ADVTVEASGGPPTPPKVVPGAPATAPATPHSWTKTCTQCRLHAPGGGAVASRLGKRGDRCGTGRQALSKSMTNLDLIKVAGRSGLGAPWSRYPAATTEDLAEMTPNWVRTDLMSA